MGWSYHIAIDLLKLEAFLEEPGCPEPWTPATSKSKDTIWNGDLKVNVTGEWFHHVSPIGLSENGVL